MHPPAITTPLQFISFYKFVQIPDPDACCALLHEITTDLLGSILVAHEGINGMLAASGEALDRFEKNLSEDPRFEARFTGIHFKRSECRTQPFGRLKIKHKPEIVPLGIPDVDATSKTGIDLDPEEWRELIAQDDVVLLDNRNSFEFRLGRFRNAIDPGVTNFRDFSAYVEEHLAEWKAGNKKVAMYCTGGIRCEKTSAWMLDLGLPVYQLKGGILNFFEKLPDAERDWDGECFVFDNRIALDTKLRETDTTAADVYGEHPDEVWRLQRAERLNDSE
ncbi:MAG: rhodanese-like domain-containing protein [Rhodocyclaceae bacterium]